MTEFFNHEEDAVPVEVNESQEEVPAEVVSEEPIQVEPEHVVFVPFEDFEGRINKTDFHFTKDLAVRVTRDEARTWIDAKKGYIR